MNGTVLSISRSLVEFQILIIETSMPAPKMRSEMTPIGLRSYYSRTAAAGKVVLKRVVLWLLVTFHGNAIISFSGKRARGALRSTSLLL